MENAPLKFFLLTYFSRQHSNFCYILKKVVKRVRIHIFRHIYFKWWKVCLQFMVYGKNVYFLSHQINLAIHSMTKTFIRRCKTVLNICGYLHRKIHFCIHYGGIQGFKLLQIYFPNDNIGWHQEDMMIHL